MIQPEKENEHGSALAMVLILVILISVSFSAVASLSQSTSSALFWNEKRSEARSALVSNALGKAVAALTYGGAVAVDGTKSLLIGANVEGANCPSTLLSDLAYVPPPQGDFLESTEKIKLKVSCKDFLQSGKSLSLASLILTGTGQDAAASPQDLCGTGALPKCEVGIDGGLYLSISGGSPDPCRDASRNRMTFGAGIINASGAWDGADCTTLALGKDAKVQQAIYNAVAGYTADDCPSKRVSFYEKGSTTRKVTCDCPGVATSNPAWYSASSADKTYSVDSCRKDNETTRLATINPFKPGTDLNGFLRSLSASIETPTQISTIGNSSSASCTGQLTPGLVTKNVWQRLLDTVKTSGCGTGGNVLQLQSGIYRFKDINLDFTAGWKKLIGGESVIESSGSCGSTPRGVQLQFEGTSQLKAKQSLVILCPLDADASRPLIVAPMQGSGFPFSSNPPRATPDDGAVLISQSGTGCSLTRCGIYANGYVVAPGANGSFYVGGDFAVVLNKGSIFKAMSLTGNASITSPSSVAPPPPFTGDRLVQLVFTGPGESDYGSVDLIIRDFYGRRRGAGVGILSWRTMW